MLFLIDPTTPAVQPIGTCFGAERPGLILTADHVVKDLEPRLLVAVCTQYSEFVYCYIEKVERHPNADVAALFIGRIKNENPLEFFDIGIPSDEYKGYNDCPLALDVLAYGFPNLGIEKPIPPRMMQGHIQAQYEYTDRQHDYRYHAYELAFPAFPGLSGSPVFGHLRNRTRVIAIVTNRISYSTEQANHKTEAHWAVGAALHPLVGWLKSL